MSLKQKQFRQKNTEHVRARDKKYREEYKDKRPEWCRAWRERNPEHVKRYARQQSQRYYRENREQILARVKQWARDNRDKSDMYKRRYVLRKATAEHEPYTYEDLIGMWYGQDGLCYYCGTPLFSRFHREHMMPLSRGGADKLENLCLSCPTCNTRKGTRTVEEFIDILEQEA